MDELQKAVIEKIRLAGGRITFAEYMAEALYHPTLGYYNRPRMTIGDHGDFFTAPAVHPIFGQCVAGQVRQLWSELGSPSRFSIVEVGAGTGALARDLLTEWDRLQKADNRDIGPSPADLRYHIVEQSAVLRQKQRETAAEAAAGRITWHTALREIPGYGSLTGVILSNELFDALPVHRLIVEGGQLRERYVTLRNTAEGDVRLEEETGPLSDIKLGFIPSEDALAGLEEGDRLEVCPLAGEVMAAMADALERGYVVTIDYGDISPNVYLKSARTGGIRCYYRQTLVADPFRRIGEQDITADVDFSYLQRTGEGKGLKTIRLVTQSEFLESFGFLDRVAELQRLAFKDLRYDFELQRMLTLYLPQGLGTACKVLVQAKSY